MATGTAAAVPASERNRTVRLSRLSDELLAHQAARGSARAFAALYERYHQQLYRYCRSILRDDADAQDALQATFTGALSALRREQRSSPLRPWLFRIAHNEAISILRHRRREGERDLTIPAAAVATPEERVVERAQWATLMSDIRGLPERQRSALLLRELSGLSHEEIAMTLDTSVGGAKQAIFEARQALAEFEEGRAMGCEEIRRRLSDGDRRVIRGRRVRAHLRACSGCETFASAMSSRRSELRAFAPLLPPAAAAALLTRSVHAASLLHGGGGAAAAGAGTGGGLASGGVTSAGATAGGAATGGAAGGGAVSMGTAAAGTALATKALAGVALVAVTAAGVTGLSHVLGGRSAPAVRTPAHAITASPAARAGARSTALSAGAGRAHGAGASARSHAPGSGANAAAGKFGVHGASWAHAHGVGAGVQAGGTAAGSGASVSSTAGREHQPAAGQSAPGSSAGGSGNGQAHGGSSGGRGASQGSGGVHGAGGPGHFGGPPAWVPVTPPAGPAPQASGSLPGSVHANS